MKRDSGNLHARRSRRVGADNPHRAMRRKLLLALTAGPLVAPLKTFAQQQTGRIRRIGILVAAPAAHYTKELAALRAGLRDLGYVEGKDIALEFRWGDDKLERVIDLAAELVRLKVDVIVTYSGGVTRIAKQATTTIPIVIAAAADPVASGLVSNLARPGGNITGLTFFGVELATKRLELLKEAFPRARRVAVLQNKNNPRRILLPEMEIAAGKLKLELQHFEAAGPTEFAAVFAGMDKSRVDAVTINEEAMVNAHAAVLGEIASRQRFASISFRQIAEAGGLIGYGADVADLWHRAASYIDKVLKGANPGDLPIERATKFELAINMKTAKALGVKFPNSILVRADKVFE